MALGNLLFATDVPFWQKSTGAEERIFALHRFLKSDGLECRVFYLGPLNDNDRSLIQEHELDVYENGSERPPEKMLNRIRWYAEATVHQARQWLTSNTKTAHPELPLSLKLADFAWPWAATRFCEVVDEFQPQAIIYEYVKMAYLMNALPVAQRERIKCLVDTHDVLYERAQQFWAHGFPHWLDIDREEESQVLGQFDAILAIQEQEAQTFAEMTGRRVPVLTVGHAVQGSEDNALLESDQGQAPGKLVVGYIGSKNFSNWQAIGEFLATAWPAVLERNGDACELVIAGEICDWFDTDGAGHVLTGDPTDPDGERDATVDKPAGSTSISHVRLLGRIERVEDFYDAIDVVINPVQFGTGLKIKNAESLRFGKLLITTLNGFNGMPEATRLACMVVETVNEMGLAINSICNDLATIRPMQQLALELSQTEFSETQAYSELRDYLHAASAAEKP